jgi:hypothetical protein
VSIYRFIIFLYILSTWFVGISIFIDPGKPNHYEPLAILPILHGIISLLFYYNYNYKTKNLAVLLISGVYYVKNVLTPYIMSLDGYVNLFPTST